MRINFKPMRRSERGYALTLTVIFLAVSLMIFGSIMYWITSNARVTLRNNQLNMSSEAAEAAVERVLAQMDRDFLNQSLTTADYYASLSIPMTNWPEQYTFSDTNGVANQISVYLGPTATNTEALNSQYAGLYGLAQDCTIIATATPTAHSGVTPISVPDTVRESLQFANIPLFQFAIFYNIDLEIDPGGSMPIAGPVFSNAGIWSGTGNVSYSSYVTSVGSVCDTSGTDPFVTGKTDNGTPSGNFTYQPTVKNNPLVMPIGTNNDPAAVRGIVLFPPAAYANGTAPAYTTNGLIYLMNGADLIISNSPNGLGVSAPTGTNFFVYFQDAAAVPYLTVVPFDYYKLKTGGTTNVVSPLPSAKKDSSTNVLYAGYTFLTNVLFYDWREGLKSGSAKTVQAVQVDVKMFNLWITNTLANGGKSYNDTSTSDKGHPVDSMYVYTAVQPTTTTLPAVRVFNGATLPSSYGFTVATPFPMYVFGNYNTHDKFGTQIGVNSPAANYHAWPAALMADSITILSAGWIDSATTLNPGSASSTTVNAAMLEGIVPSDQATKGVSIPSAGGGGTYTGYSGGVENFLRLLENWSGDTLTYNGSIVVMFPSYYATNHWAGSYYSIPTRKWAFDQNFTTSSGLPPLTPQSKAVIRGQWLDK